MTIRITGQALRKVTELSYVTAENVARYRAIMRWFYHQYNRHRFWLKPEEVHEGVMSCGCLDDYTLEQCQQDLERLAEWGNLASRHDAGRASTIEEYMRKKLQYSLTAVSIEIERLLESLENVTGHGGSLEPTLLDKIQDKLEEVRVRKGEFRPGEAGRLWEELYESFIKLHENSADYIASLQTAKAEELMMTEQFLLFKEKLIHYLQNFVQALQHHFYQIEGHLLNISPAIRERFLERVAEDEWSKPRIEEGPSKEEWIVEMRQRWDNLQRWFLGVGTEPSELTLLERATKDAIARIVRCVIRIQERKRAGVSRRKELEYLARWFYRLEKLEDAHKLAAYAFGLFPTRHLQGEDFRESDRADLSMWEESPTILPIRSRSRKRLRQQHTEPVRDRREEREKTRQALLEAWREEWNFLQQMLERGEFRMSELEVISAKTRLRLLHWIGRCTAVPSRLIRTPEGIAVRLEIPPDGKMTVLRCEDGELHLPDYRMVFQQADAVSEALREAAASSEEPATVPDKGGGRE